MDLNLILVILYVRNNITNNTNNNTNNKIRFDLSNLKL
jgi:hypothetical protein